MGFPSLPRHWRNGLLWLMSGSVFACTDEFIPKRKASSNLFCLFICGCGIHLLKQRCKLNHEPQVPNLIFGCGWMDAWYNETLFHLSEFSKHCDSFQVEQGSHIICNVTLLVAASRKRTLTFQALRNWFPRQMQDCKHDGHTPYIPSWNHPNFK